MTIDLTTPWPDAPWVVLDFETTSAEPSTCMPVSVACVRFEGGKEVDRLYELVNPGCEIPAEATAIHNIRTEDVRDARGLEFHLDALRMISRGAAPVAYCAQFDRTILHRFANDAECTLFDHGLSWIDPLVCVRDIDKWVRGTGRHRLSNACQRHGVDHGSAHNALSDARATASLLSKLGSAGMIRACPLDTLLKRIDQRRVRQDAEYQSWLARQPTRGDGHAV